MAGFVDDITVEDLERDPYPIYARLRTEAPVAFIPAVNVWMVTRWADVSFAGTRAELFSADAPTSPVDRTFGSPTVLTCDGPMHRDLRAAIDPKFRPRAVDAYVADLVTPLAERAAADIEGHGHAELMSEYFEPISVLALGQVLGLGDVDAGTLRRWFTQLADGATNFEREPAKQATADAAVREIRDQLSPMLTRLAAEPDDSAISHMLHSGMTGGRPRTIDRIFPSLLVILLGGMQEPGHGAGSALWGLLSQADQTAEVIAAPAEHVAAVVDEGLRYISPIGSQLRRATADVELSGVVVPEGSEVALNIASANRDPARFDEPDRFDIHRVKTQHAAFGFGRHFCSGHWFARQVERIAIRVLIEHLPDVALDPERPARFRGWEFRAPRNLNVTFRPRS